MGAVEIGASLLTAYVDGSSGAVHVFTVRAAF
jgi:hypothetical protein